METVYVTLEGRAHRIRFTSTTLTSTAGVVYQRRVLNGSLVKHTVQSVLDRYRHCNLFTCDIQHIKNVIDFTAAIFDALHDCDESMSRQDIAAKLTEAI
ncbi:hypothetical protein HK102_003391, partial [Quaeritorhiza haematococci]